MADELTSSLGKAGYRDFLAPKTYRAIEELKALKNPSYSDIESVRQLLNRAGADPNGKGRGAPRDRRHRRLHGGLKDEHVVTGDAAAAAKMSTEARGTGRPSRTLKPSRKRSTRPSGRPAARIPGPISTTPFASRSKASSTTQEIPWVHR